MKTLSFLILCAFFSSAVARAEADVCYQNEINPRTKKIYATQDEWALDLQEWSEKEPPHPGFFNLFKAYNAYKSASAVANSLKKDKQAHCYMGCVIRNVSNQETVTYTAWLKESRDLQDCSKSTHFEAADMAATIAGGLIGESAATPEECLELCRQQF